MQKIRVSIKTNYDYELFERYQQRDNKKGINVWLGGSDERVESVWEWSDGTPWANESVARCSKVRDIQKFGLQGCTNWEQDNPKGGKERNCLLVTKSHTWMSYYCEDKRLPYWCQISPTRLKGNTKPRRVKISVYKGPACLGPRGWGPSVYYQLSII